LLDAGITPRTVATWTGFAMIVPALLWTIATQSRKSVEHTQA